MRLVAAVALCSFASLAHADPVPTRLSPQAGHFFDDPIAVSSDGKSLAALSTDAATSATLHLFSPGATPAEQNVDGLPVAVTAVSFIGASRVLVVYKKEGSERAYGVVASIHDGKAGKSFALDAGRLGPADVIEAVDRDGKRVVSLYSRSAKKTGVEHEVQLLAGDTLKSIGHRTLVENNEGLVRSHLGLVRPLWWSHAHTQLAAQKIGSYDRAKDMRSPDRFARLDVVSDKVIEEHEIGDVLAFAKLVLTRKASPPDEVFAHLSDDHKELRVLDGLTDQPIKLERPLDVYDANAIHSLAVDDKTLVVQLQVDPSNEQAIARHTKDADDIDVYEVDRSTKSARRVLTIPGLGRPAAFTAVPGHVAILRKGRGFDRGGVSIELYALP